jgi:hypothetical protein
MKSPVIAIEIRYRPVDADDLGGMTWRTQRFAPGAAAFELLDLDRGGEYEYEVYAIGIGELRSEPTTGTFTVAVTNREGAAALPPVVAGNVSSRWKSGTLSWVATDTLCTVSFTGPVLQIGDKEVTYSDMAVEISGVADEERTIFLYVDDLYAAGGVRTLGWTADKLASSSSYQRFLVDQLTITFDSAGGTGTSGGGAIDGGGGGSGPTCPDEDAWFLRKDVDGVVEPVRWKDARNGDLAMLEDGRWKPLSHLRRCKAQRVRVVFGEERTATCSRTGPLRRANGGQVVATAAVGARLAYRRHGEPDSAIVARVEDAGWGWVIQFSCEESFVWFGDDPDHMLAHHNIKAGP